MRAISVRAPWWWFILNCGKDIENRDWPTDFRGRVLIHASKWWNKNEVDEDFAYAIGCWEVKNSTAETLSCTEPNVIDETLNKIRSRGGCIVGSVEIVDCVKQSNSPWFFGEYGFVLANPIALAKPIPYKGALGVFYVPDSILGEKAEGR